MESPTKTNHNAPHTRFLPSPEIIETKKKKSNSEICVQFSLIQVKNAHTSPTKVPNNRLYKPSSPKVPDDPQRITVQ